MSNGYGQTDTILGGIPAFTGHNSKDWILTRITWHIEDDTLMRFIDYAEIRFTFQSDSMDNDKEGWIIGRIGLELIDFCYLLAIENENIKEQYVTIFPNPLVIKSIMNFNIKDAQKILIYNLYGQVVDTYNINGKSELTLNSDNYISGIYYYVLIKDSLICDTGKFIVIK